MNKKIHQSTSCINQPLVSNFFFISISIGKKNSMILQTKNALIVFLPARIYQWNNSVGD